LLVLAAVVLLVSSPLPANSQALPVPTRGKASFDPKTGVYLPPPPNREPEYRKGQKFLVLDTTLLDYRESSDKTKDIRLQVLTLKDYDREIPDPAAFNPDLYFLSIQFEKIQGFGALKYGRSSVAEDRIDDLGGIFPLVEDDDVRYLQKKYEGKTVYPYGNVAVTAIPAEDGNTTRTTLQFNYLSPLRVLRIVRVRTKEAALAPTGIADVYRKTHSPLVIVLKPLKGSTVVAFDISTNRATRKNSGYAGYYLQRFAPWDFEKTFSLSSPAHIAKLAAPKLGKALLAGGLRRGMTGEMVARICGFPPSIDSRAANLERLTSPATDEWRFPSNPPFAFIVKFERGKVVSWGENYPRP
ncbi:MAG: hypothetical protein H7Y38_12300, partial [Armatimonadetes bacterium]|nr:hypothetical protein [Armatimonadota bacterium]